MIVANQLEHHVKGGGAAGAGVYVAVDLIEVGEGLGLGETFGEAGDVFPMDRAALARQKAGEGENVGAGAEAADGDAAIMFLAQPGENRLVVEFLDIDAGADDDHVRPLAARQFGALLGKRAVGCDLDGIGCADGAAVSRGQPPGIIVRAEHQVGQPKRLDRHGKGDHGKFRDEVEYE